MHINAAAAPPGRTPLKNAHQPTHSTADAVLGACRELAIIKSVLALLRGRWTGQYERHLSKSPESALFERTHASSVP